jgi:CheY-like chemotaxis protein
VVTAEHGQAALDLLRRGLQPRVIVLDLSMPQMDGVTFREQQLTDPMLPRCPVIVCSAVLDSAQQLERLKASPYLQSRLNRKCSFGWCERSASREAIR